jgi:hypothetical protein
MSANCDHPAAVLPFGRLWYGEPDAINNAIGYAKLAARSHYAVIRAYDKAGNVIETHEHAGDFREWDALRSARLALIPCWRHTTFVRSGRSGRLRETKGVTVTVPLLTGREIRALKRPEASSV